MSLDPATHAVRRDLADIRLAEFVFAPHYAAPVAMASVQQTSVLSSPDLASSPVHQLAPGDVFEALDFSGKFAWGIATKVGLVGYVERSALTVTTDVKPSAA